MCASFKTFHILQTSKRWKKAMNSRKNCLTTRCKDLKRVFDSLNVEWKLKEKKMECDKQTHACGLAVHQQMLYLTVCKIYFILRIFHHRHHVVCKHKLWLINTNASNTGVCVCTTNLQSSMKNNLIALSLSLYLSRSHAPFYEYVNTWL